MASGAAVSTFPKSPLTLLVLLPQQSSMIVQMLRASPWARSFHKVIIRYLRALYLGGCVDMREVAIDFFFVFFCTYQPCRQPFLFWSFGPLSLTWCVTMPRTIEPNRARNTEIYLCRASDSCFLLLSTHEAVPLHCHGGVFFG